MTLAIVLNLALLCHLLGDYVLQSDWMAQQKTKSSLPALVHAITYSLPFWGLVVWAGYEYSAGMLALLVITSTHYLIDRYRLARYVCWVKNFLGPKNTVETVEYQNPPDSVPGVSYKQEEKLWHYPWNQCKGTGYHESRPPWMAVWLLIIADNTMHLVINAAALAYFWS